MAFNLTFKFAPAEWLPFRDDKVLLEIENVDMYAHEGKNNLTTVALGTCLHGSSCIYLSAHKGYYLR